jgi:hypothetical protein
LVDLTFILSKLDEVGEGATILIPEVQAVRSKRVPRTRFWCTPIELNEEMEDVEESMG